jgi:hypothetical protein
MSLKKLNEIKNNILLTNDSADIIWAISNELEWGDLRYILELFNEERLDNIKNELDALRELRKL